MGEKIFDLVKNLATGKHSKIFWVILIIIVVLAIIVFPYIDANFLYYSRIEKRIDNLNNLVLLSGEELKDSPVLLAEYNNIIEEIKVAQEKNITSFFENKSDSKFDYWAKFLSGAFLCWLFGIIVFFQKDKNSKLTLSYFLKNNFLAFVFCIGLGVVLVFVFSKLPVFGSIWVNIIGVPILQLILLYFLFTKTESKKENK